ncbi:tRNA 2-selenouridine(34) synthase MnmH [Halobacillus shinanisalinarum]|uniref:tRNA 2-selenouridine(34) synthase MnmH n=1 Tax=Halobacillus shinanisalinarum TaxID=2932258 RepID=A0ABY4H4M0_9BACI|nr:tRNA 2-selenouridine(34) synthase MnmH [Halobacillus shinanisalinarum]UOQ95304.1 tRNA 2-selenouridine(34) synthase MnmH [Halobacillus shinanisalinarum]
MYQDITLNKLFTLQNSEEITFVDVRSPSEYNDATIPGSLNIPVFNDEERAEVGTLYKQVNSQAAKERGLEIFSAKLPQFIKKFSQIDTRKAVFCWRGGMRSNTAATVLDLMGIHVYRLEGGIRSYRQWVVHTLEQLEFEPRVYTLNGYTGSGKTTILRHLQKEGYPVLNLEKMANHRGSIFGQIGLDPNNQKKFESLLVQDLFRFQKSPYVLLEGESKRIGKAVLPDFLYNKKEQGTQLFIDLPINERIMNILDDYQPWNHQEECIEAFRIIKKRIHTPIANEIESHLENGEFYSAVQLLLEYYYDPLYDHNAKQYPDNSKIIVQANNITEAIKSVQNIVDELQVK